VLPKIIGSWDDDVKLKNGLSELPAGIETMKCRMETEINIIIELP
jgi:hypothetical protein